MIYQRSVPKKCGKAVVQNIVLTVAFIPPLRKDLT